MSSYENGISPESTGHNLREVIDGFFTPEEYGDWISVSTSGYSIANEDCVAPLALELKFVDTTNISQVRRSSELPHVAVRKYINFTSPSEYTVAHEIDEEFPEDSMTTYALDYSEDGTIPAEIWGYDSNGEEFRLKRELSPEEIKALHQKLTSDELELEHFAREELCKLKTQRATRLTRIMWRLVGRVDYV